MFFNKVEGLYNLRKASEHSVDTDMVVCTLAITYKPEQVKKFKNIYFIF